MEIPKECRTSEYAQSEELLKKLHPNLKYAEFKTVTSPVILLDIGLNEMCVDQLNKTVTANGQTLEILEGSKLIKTVERIIQKLYKEDEETIFIFPGRGSKYILDNSKVCGRLKIKDVHAERIWIPGENPLLRIGQVEGPPFLDTKTRTIVVVDDVVASGQTMRQLRLRNSFKFSANPTWVGVSLASRFPEMNTKSGIIGYEQTYTGCILTKTDGRKPPINSMSTLIKQPEIAQDYASRNLKNPKDFMSLIKLIKATHPKITLE